MDAFAMQQNLFLLVIGISTLAAGLTFLGVPLAELFDVPHRPVSGALQFARHEKTIPTFA